MPPHHLPFDTTYTSPYREAMERGHARLLFGPALEAGFRDAQYLTNLAWMRWVSWIGIATYLAFVAIDLATIPLQASRWTAAIRLLLIVPTLVVALAVSYRTASRAVLTPVVFLTATVVGCGTVGIVVLSLALGAPVPYEGTLLLPFVIHLLLGLPWRQALGSNLIALAMFVVLVPLVQPDRMILTYQLSYMLLANVLGAWGGYALEHRARASFLTAGLLSELAERDGLTGIHNRRSFNDHLERVWKQAAREGGNVGLALIDVDHFKQFNDRHGHGEGDAALRAVADVLGAHANRPLDLAARYGGEEFALIWYDPQPDQLHAMGERVRRDIAALELHAADARIDPITVSAGVAVLRPRDIPRHTDLLRAADIALYQAKHGGRDRVVVLSHPAPGELRFPGTPVS
ncbi:GGDEF domain-containing protein [Novilysobacter spongiicola]|uniref:diguanylate cyclase n=1 Tax=Lysobacter spongiicola DSM 21749 TaxID=1122188 RepID=A0A1T4R8D6_9GAMM|nr:GGDEF domain-containing protein [Lysobacter spongiicola]SKA12076.1 diguanylate cyclase (GGDEF) domain-containing protein [Lysobacter spongiicola DSM 21749]